MKTKAKLTISLLLMATVASGCQSNTTSTESISGIDSNNNGIRDDVELAIDKKYSSIPSDKIAVYKVAKAIQYALIINKLDINQVSQANAKITTSTSCLASTFTPSKNKEHFASVTEFLESATVNTKTRKAEYEKFNRAVEHAKPYPTSENCQAP